MRVHELAFAWCLVTSLWQIGCASVADPPPRNWLPRPREARDEAYGGWVVLEFPEPPNWPIEGELLAVDPDSVYVLERSGFRAVSWREVVRAKVTAYDSEAREMAGWATLGAVSTLTHGYVLILTAPAWLVVGNGMTKAQARLAQRVYPDYDSLEDIARFARFPGGMPSGLDRSRLVLSAPRSRGGDSEKRDIFDAP